MSSYFKNSSPQTQIHSAGKHVYIHAL